MSLFKIFDIAGSAINAESLRLNLVASNLANSESVSESEANVYRARQPIFTTILDDEATAATGGVKLSGVMESEAPTRREYRPDHPFADSDGYVHLPNVNAIEEMTNMMSASRAYQTNVETINSVKQLLLRTLSLGQ
jgi:flagellar basal-body rod protein FlgC